jgi:6-phosphofructokinase 2
LHSVNIRRGNGYISTSMPIVTITLNPALDLTTAVDRVESGYKLRCGPARLDPGGGGVNVSRAIAKLGGTSQPFIAIGGATGSIFRSLLDAEGIDAEWFAVGGATRQSIVVGERSSGKQFRFVLPGPEWSAEEAGRCLAAIRRLLADAGRDNAYAVLSGSLPPGLPADFYQSIAAVAAETGARVALDTSGRQLDLAAHGAGPALYIWIMDQGEAEHVAVRPLESLDALETFARDLHGRGLAEIVILTFSEGGAVAVSASGAFRISPPKVEVISKVGAGDSFVGGLIMKLAAGAPLYESCAYAVAAAASAVTTPATTLCDAVQTEAYFSMILSGQTSPFAGV